MPSMNSDTIGPQPACKVPSEYQSKPVKFAVLSDIHYYYPLLGTTGEAFRNHLATDRKMLAESESILLRALAAIRKSDAQFVLICGDLTKDGEYICHQRFADFLTELANAGKNVYVINGNHDIYNPSAFSYNGSKKIPIKNTSPRDFQRLYYGYGYEQAIAVDPNSLSYVVEPAPGLRIIAMDSCIYNKNSKFSVTNGALPPERLNWVKYQIQAATSQGNLVMGMMHHGIVPHFSVKPAYYSEYLVTNYKQAAKAISGAGMNIVFTGHFHAQNIAKKKFSKDDYLIDVETGSLVTYPVPYRLVEITADFKKVKISSYQIKKASCPSPDHDFQTYAKNFTAQKMRELFIQIISNIIVQAQPAISPASAFEFAASLNTQYITKSLTVADLFVNAMLAHYHGDQKPDLNTKKLYQALAASNDSYYQVIGRFLLSISADSNLGDNAVTIDLSTGEPVSGLLHVI